MKKITLFLDGEVARWARIKAAEQNISVSRLVGEMLKRKMQEEEAYVLAMEQFLAAEPTCLKKAGERYPQRKDIHER
jgi:hypothetical protein